MTRGARVSLMLVGVAVVAGLATVAAVIYVRANATIAAAARPPVLGAVTSRPLSPAFEPTTRPADNGRSVRVAVIGGMVETGFWQALAERYRQETGVTVELITAGPKTHLERAFRTPNPGIDLITMHASDTIINLVADGYCTDPQPWMRNDQVIVGPAEDPAKIRGLSDAAEAFRRIAQSKSRFVVHSSIGTQEVLHGILETEKIQLEPGTVTQLFLDNQRNVLQIAAEKRAYTLVGRIPFRSGKLPNSGLELMVAGDVRLRRPYLVAVTNPAKVTDVHIAQARRFAAYLREAGTQAWIGEFGRGKLDDQPLFFPVEVGVR